MQAVRQALRVAALCAVTAMSVPAQVEWQLSGFEILDPSRFRATMLFRNTQQFGGGPIVSITNVSLSASSRLRVACGQTISCAGFIVNNVELLGAVDTRSLTIDGRRWSFVPNQWRGDCRVFSCFEPRWEASELGLFGCLLPDLGTEAIGTYAGRTCVGEGFDGWLAIPFEFRSVGPLGFTPDVSDVTAQFGLRSFTQGNIYPVPEPSTYALMATGLAGLAWTARRRRAAGSEA